MSHSTQCPRCKGTRKPQFAICWRCHTDDRLHSEYKRGLTDGLRAGGSHVDLDDRRLRQLIQLCHPDRHAGSVAATNATQWLLEQRQRLLGARS
jgi:hypothetical protein